MDRVARLAASFTIPFFFSAPAVPAQAADPNGYTAQYECRAGGSFCDLDVVTLGNRACDGPIISAATPWSAIDWSNNTICLEAGDHSGKGTLTIPAGFSGSASNYKVLRYYRPQDSDDDPWDQSEANQAKLQDLVLDGVSFWLVHRLTFPASSAAATAGDYRVELAGLATDNVFNRLLVEGNPSVASAQIKQLYGGIGSTSDTSHRTTIQNSVIRTNYSRGTGSACVGTPPLGEDVRVVNNEIYDWCEHNYQMGENNLPVLGGAVVENNDLYYNNPAFTGHAEGNVVFKASGTSSKPQRVIHNRIWGTRWATMCCAGGGGEAIHIAGRDQPPFNHASYVLIQNNVMFDNIYGVVGHPGQGTNHSIVGNLLYSMERHNGSHDDSAAFALWGVGGLSEFYLNTVIESERYFDFQGADNQDLRCNVAVFAGASVPPMGANSQIDHNVYYGTTNNGETTRISKTPEDRANFEAYDVGDIIRIPGTCAVASDAACFLYNVIVPGTSAATPPDYCTTGLGCTTTDGSMTVQAVRGPYVFRRKLRTGAEDYIIPYATVHETADEAEFCPQSTGSRSGMGINDDQLGSGVLVQDLDGEVRQNTPGALEAESGDPDPDPNPEQFPHPPGPASIPGRIEAEYYDEGGEGVAYHDVSPENEAAQWGMAAYRANESVEVEITADASGVYDVGWIQPGEWLEYTVQVATTGIYDIEIRHASSGPGGTMRIYFGNTDVSGQIMLPDTGGWQTWASTYVNGVQLQAGEYVMRLAFETGNDGWLANLNYVAFAAAANNPPPVGIPHPDPNVAAAIPGTVEAEYYDEGGEGEAYHDVSSENEAIQYGMAAYRANESVEVETTADESGAYDVGWIQAGEWLAYSVNVETAGTYQVEIRHASLGFGGILHIEFSGNDVTGPISLPDTGDWQVWSTTTVTGVMLSAGQQRMKLFFDSGNQGWLANINWVRFTRTGP